MDSNFPNPFGLSPSKPVLSKGPFDKLRANGGNPQAGSNTPAKKLANSCRASSGST